MSEVLRLLPQLNDEEANQVLLCLKARRSLSIVPSVEHVDWLLEGIYGELRSRGLVSPNWRISSVDLRRIAANYEGEAAAVRVVLIRGLSLSFPQRLALGRLAAMALARYLLVPIGPKTLLRNVSRTIEAFEASYPSYLECGLVSALLPGAQKWTDTG